MALGRHKGRQSELLVTWAEMPRSPGHAFYDRLQAELVSDVQAMTEQLRGGLVAKAPPVRLAGEVEIDEVYVVAGHKGQPAAVAKRGGLDAVADWRERRAAARWRRTSRPSSA